MSKKYPDPSVLFEMKAEWRKHMAQRPIEEKIEAVNRLREVSRNVGKLVQKNKQGLPKK